VGLGASGPDLRLLAGPLADKFALHDLDLPEHAVYEVVSPRGEESAAPLDADSAAVPLRIDRKDAGGPDREVVDVRLAPGNPAIVEKRDPGVGRPASELGGASPVQQRPLPMRARAPADRSARREAPERAEAVTRSALRGDADEPRTHAVRSPPPSTRATDHRSQCFAA
jgi:hypothetical protein